MNYKDAIEKIIKLSESNPSASLYFADLLIQNLIKDMGCANFSHFADKIENSLIKKEK